MSEERPANIDNVVSRYGNRLFGFIRKRVSNNADAEDILQEVWYQLSRVVDTDSIEQLSGWLFRVARNKVTDSYRKQRPDSIEEMGVEDEEGAQQPVAELLMADFIDPGDEELKEIFWETLFAALDLSLIHI